MARTDFVDLPVHACGVLVIDLHPVNAHVAHASFRIACVDIWQGNETPTVFWPAFENGKIAK